MLNLTASNSYHVFDSYGMLIIPSDELSWRDSIGRTVLAWIAYRRPRELHTGIILCLENTSINEDIPEWELFRHPDHDELVSRDHMSYFIIHSFLLDKEWTINSFIPYLSAMRGMNLWMKSLTGNKRAERLYYLIYIPGAIIGNIWLRICRWVGRIGPERDNNWWIRKDSFHPYRNNGLQLQHSLTKWQKLLGRIISISIPAYALHNKAWQIYVMPDSKRKERLKRILLKRVGKSNIMLRLLFGDTTVTQQEVDNYPHLTGYRAGVYLNTTRRTIRKLTEQEAEFNTYEKDLIIWLFEQQKKEIFKRIHECTSKVSNLTKGMLMFADAIVDTNKVFLKFKEAVSLFKRT